MPGGEMPPAMPEAGAPGAEEQSADNFGAVDAAAGGAEALGREKR